MDGIGLSIGARIPWLPDETLFSWCSRYHLLAANGLASATCAQLFGKRRQGVAHDFPAGIGALVDRAAGSLGTSMDIIHDRTVLPFYAPFKTSDLIERAKRLMIGDGIGSLKYQLGLLTSGLGAAHPLKACPSCMTEDRRRSAVTYWHRAHQLPAVWFCPTHGDALLVSPLKLDQLARFQWALPSEAGLAPWASPEVRHIDQAQSIVARKVASLGVELCALPSGLLADAGGVARAFRHGMARRGWVHASGRIEWRQFDGDLRHHAAAVGTLPPMAMQNDGAAARSQLTRILSARSLTHPLRYVAWMAMLFDSLADFVLAYESSPSALSPVPPTAHPSENLRVDSRAAGAVMALLSCQESLTAIAHRLNVTPSTVAAWAAKAGLEPPRRPKVFDNTAWLAATEMLADGRSKTDVARMIGGSKVTVTRILRSVPGLQSRWHAVRHEAAREQARRAWLAVIEASRVLGTVAARRAEPAAYAWLYRNDRTWLLQQRVHLDGNRAGDNHSAARKRRADERYARALKLSYGATGRVGSLDPLQPENWAILAPGLKRVLRSPASWPLTMSVLRLALAPRSESSSAPLL